MLCILWELKRGRVNSSLMGFDPSAKASWTLLRTSRFCVLMPHCSTPSTILPYSPIMHLPGAVAVLFWCSRPRFPEATAIFYSPEQGLVWFVRPPTSMIFHQMMRIERTNWTNMKSKATSSLRHDINLIPCFAAPCGVLRALLHQSQVFWKWQIRAKQKMRCRCSYGLDLPSEFSNKYAPAHTLSPAIEPSQRLTSR